MITFTLPFPPSCNTLYPGKARRYKSKKYELWEIEAKIALYRQNVPSMNDRCIAHYSLNHPDERIRDCANYEKAITDVLVKHGILKGDDRKHIQGVNIYWNDQKGNDVLVKITPHPEEF